MAAASFVGLKTRDRAGVSQFRAEVERITRTCVQARAMALQCSERPETLRPRVNRTVTQTLVLAAMLLGGIPGCAGVVKVDDGPGEGTSERSQHAAASSANTSARARAPIRFEGRRGTTLPITRLEIAARSVDPLAQVAMEIEVANPDPERVRGTLFVAVPADARIERFAVRDGTGWYEAKMVARPLPRPSRLELPSDVAVRDPSANHEVAIALEGIAPRGRMTIHLVWSRVLAHDGDRLHVPLRGLPPVGELDVELWSSETMDDGTLAMTPTHLRSRGVAPTEDLWGPIATRRAGVRSGDVTVARVVPLHHDHAAPVSGLTVLFDTSASRVLAHEAQVDALHALLRSLATRLPASTPLRVVAYDQTARTVFDASLGAWDGHAVEQLRRIRPAGASDLLGALEHVRTLPGPGGRRDAGGASPPSGTPSGHASHDVTDVDAVDSGSFDRLLVVGDGVSTAGLTGREAIDAALEGLRGAGYRRIDALVDGTPRDAASLARLAHGLDRRGLVLDGSREDATTLSRRIVRDVARIRLSAPDAVWAWPEVVEDVQASDEVVVWARVDPEVTDAAVSWLVTDEHGEARSIDASYGSVHDASLVRDAFAGAQVDALVAALQSGAEQPLEARRAAYRRALSLARGRGVTSAFTAPELPARAPARPIVSAMDLTHALNLVDAQGVLVDVLPPSGEDAQAATRGIRANDVSRATPRRAEERTPRPDDGSAASAELTTNELVGLDGPPPRRTPDDAHTGRMLAIESLIAWGRPDEALRVAEAWNTAAPTDTLSWVAVARAHESRGDEGAAARSWGSLLDLHPTRVDVRRLVAGRLDGLGGPSRRQAVDVWRRAAVEQPNDVVVARGYAHALLRRGHDRWAVELLARAIVATEGAAQALDSNERRVVDAQVAELRAELAMLGGAALTRTHDESAPAAAREEERNAIADALRSANVTPDARPVVRAILSWDTAGSDADLHVRDEDHVHAWYRRPRLGSGGVVSSDASTWTGVETLTLTGEALAQTHDVQVHWYALGPLGFGAGRLTVLRHDGRGGIDVEARPFVVTREHATVSLGTIAAAREDETR